MRYSPRDPKFAQAIAAEHAILGAILYRPEALDAVPTELGVEDFIDPKAQAVWGAIMNLVAESEPIGPLTVEAELVRLGRIDAVGGLGALGVWTIEGSGLTDELVAHHTNDMRQSGLARRVRHEIAGLAESIARNDPTGDEALSTLVGIVNRLSASAVTDATSTIGEGVARRFEELSRLEEAQRDGQAALTGLPTGVVALDAQIGGWQPGIVNGVAGRPGMGKSSLILATMDACSQAGYGAHLFTLEDALSAHADRAISRDSRVPATSLRALKLNATQLVDMRRTRDRLRDRKGWIIDDRAGVSAQDIVRSARRHQRENKTRVVVIDYVNLVKRSRRDVEGHEAIEEILAEFQISAKNDGLAYVAVFQLNRNVERRDDRRPVMSDLRDGGEEKPKIIVGLYRGAHYYGEPKPGIDWDANAPVDSTMPRCRPTAYEFERTIQLCVIKNNQGPTGVIYAKWDAPTTTIT